MEAAVDLDPNSLPKLVLTHPSGAAVEIYLQGAHVASWQCADGGDVLFMSRESRFEPGVPIRGGIPVVFPQFSKRGDLPQHGFARNRPWDVVENGVDERGAAFARLRLIDSQETRELWPHRFLAELIVRVAHDLSATLRVTNTDGSPFGFTTALHTYYAVDDVRNVYVEGLRGSRYTGTPQEDLTEGTEPLRIRQETDVVYSGVGRMLRIRDVSPGRSIVITTDGFADAVVWNPWVEKANSMPDFGADEYLRMLCVEPGNIEHPIRLNPGETWSGSQIIRVAEGK